MNAHVDIEELQTTKTEKLLAAVLSVFLLIGLVWAYQEIDDWVKDDRPAFVAPPSSPESARRDRARERVGIANRRERQALQELELRREAYRTALDANRPARDLERAYISAQNAYRRAQRERAAAERELRAAEPAAQAAERRAFEEAENRRQRDERNTFLLRLALAVLAIGLAYLLLWHLHGRPSRYLPLAFAAVVSSTLLAFVMAGDYLTDYLDPLDLGPLALALVGSAATIVAFYLLQRYIVRRLPSRRLRKGQCPFCGYPSRGGPRCEGCGRDLVAPCAKCGSERRVGVLYCGACGAM